MPLLIAGGVVVALYLVLSPILNLLTGSSGSSRTPSYYYDYAPADSGTSVGAIIAVFLIGLIIAVLLANRYVVWSLVTRRFGRHPVARLSAPSARDRQIL